MNIETVQNHIVSKFDAFWTHTPLEHANTTIQKVGLEAWARLTIKHDAPKAINFALNSIRSGVVNVQVFTQYEIGQGLAVKLACLAGEFFKSIPIGTLVFKPYSIVILENKATEGLTTTETIWYQVNCQVEFTFID